MVNCHGCGNRCSSMVLLLHHCEVDMKQQKLINEMLNIDWKLGTWEVVV